MSVRLSGGVMSLEEALQWRAALRQESLQVVLTNGCFDLLHRGHLDYLEQSAGLGDRLIVAVNSDASVRELKGPGRPINSEEDRAYALSCLRFVDAAFIFDGPRLDREILLLRPDLYTKAGDYTVESFDRGERKALEEVGTEIRIMQFRAGHSTTEMIERANH